MAENPDNQDLQPAPDVDEERRSFLKTSVYAVYATPLITALLVEKANAADSLCTPRWQSRCRRRPWIPFCREHC